MTFAVKTIGEHVEEFDQAHAEALRQIWIVGDVHGQSKPLLRSLARSPLPAPAWIVFVGDIDLDPEIGSFRQWLKPVHKLHPQVQVAFIPGNHDADHEDRWERLMNCGRALPLHGRVLDMGGIRVAGLGGVFMARIWYPPAAPLISERPDFAPHPVRLGKLPNSPRPAQHAAIYEAEWLALGAMRSDLLITHEAPSCHPHGFEAIDDLARALGVVRAFHGHHHDDQTAEYLLHRERMGFEAVALGYCAIKTAAGEVVATGELGW
jgi:hypothetical protein